MFYVKDGCRKQVVTKERLMSVMRLCHEECGSHLGRDKTYQKVKERYFWNTITKDVGDFLKVCEECQRNNKKTKTTVAEMIPVPVPDRVWEKIGIDLIGPFLNSDGMPISSNGYKYVLTCMDYTSKWPEAYPLYSKSTAEIGDKLYETICRFGVMKEIVSDQGGEFNSHLITYICKTFNIKHVTTSPYHPQSNGMVEKFNQTLKSMINKTITNNAEDWDKYITKCLFNYRTSVHHSTKFSPFYVMYLRQPVLPNETLDNYTVERDNASQNDNNNVEQVVEKLEIARKEISIKLKQNVKIAQEKQKAAYDKRHNVDEKQYEIGQQVLLKNFRRKAGMATVNQLKYQGPYKILQYKGKGNFLLWNEELGKKIGPHNQKNFKAWISQDLNACDKSENTCTGHTNDDSDGESIFKTQDKFRQIDNSDLSSPVFHLSPTTDDTQDYNEKKTSRHGRKRKIRQSSIYEYF